MSQEFGPWAGASGFEHVFHVYPRGEAIPPRMGLYIYARRDAKGVWLPVYMGEGDLAVCCQDPDLLACIDAKGATHIHMRLCPAAEDRAAEFADITERYQNTFAPVGCNPRVPGAGAAPEVAPAG